MKVFFWKATELRVGEKERSESEENEVILEIPRLGLEPVEIADCARVSGRISLGNDRRSGMGRLETPDDRMDVAVSLA